MPSISPKTLTGRPSAGAGVPGFQTNAAGWAFAGPGRAGARSAFRPKTFGGGAEARDEGTPGLSDPRLRLLEGGGEGYSLIPDSEGAATTRRSLSKFVRERFAQGKPLAHARGSFCY